MKRIKTFVLLFIIFIFASFFLAVGEKGNVGIANGEDLFVGQIKVSFAQNKYTALDNGGKSHSEESLQDLLSYVGNNVSGTAYLFFDEITTDSPLYFGYSVTIGGTINCNIPQSEEGDFAIVTEGESADLRSLILNTNRGGFLIKSGNLAVNECYVNFSAEKITPYMLSGIEFNGGTADFVKCNINYNGSIGQNTCGLNIRSGKVTCQSNVTVVAPVALATATNLLIKGGSYSGGEKGLSLMCQSGSMTTIEGGSFPQNIEYRAGSKALTIEDGEFSHIKQYPNGEGLKIKNLPFPTPAFTTINIDLSKLEENEVQLSSDKIESGGYRIVKVKMGENICQDNKVMVAEESVLTIEESNVYTITLKCDGEIYDTLEKKYQTTLSLAELPFPNKSGYHYVGWQEYDDSVSDFKVTEDTELNIITELDKVSIGKLDKSFPYDDTSRTILPEITHPLKTEEGFAVSYSWQRYKNYAFLDLGTADRISVKDVADSGIYRVVITATFGSDTSILTTDFSITISKGVYKGITHESFEGVYNPLAMLAIDYPLSEGFRWVNGQETPNVTKQKYDAIYNVDSNNYYDCYIKVDVILAKGSYDASQHYHSSLYGTYSPDKKLKDYELGSYYRWEDESIVPTVDGMGMYYAALYNEDRANYEDARIMVGVFLGKATYGADKKVNELQIVYGDFWDNSELIGYLGTGYTIEDTIDFSLIGEVKTNCVFCGDSTNYYPLEFVMTLTIVKANYNKEDLELPLFEELLPFTEQLKDIALVGEFWVWKNPEEKIKTGSNQYLALYNDDQTHYNDFEWAVTLNVDKRNYDINNITIPSFEAITYDYNRKLGDLLLPEFFSWKDANIIPSVNQTKYAVVYFDGNEDYKPLELEVVLSVNKATVPPITLQPCLAVYDGNPHYFVAELPYPMAVDYVEGDGMIFADNYTVFVHLLQEDKENYYEVTDLVITGEIRIGKATPVIIALESYTFFEGSGDAIKGVVNNLEQSVSCPDISHLGVGEYTLTLTVAESSNYLAASKTVSVVIIPYVYPEEEEITAFFGRVNREGGLEEGIDYLFSVEERYDDGVVVLLSLTKEGVEITGKYDFRLLATKQMLSAKNLSLTVDDEIIDFELEKGYILFSTNANSLVRINYAGGDMDEKHPQEDNSLQWWAVLLITLGSVALLGGGVMGVLILSGKIHIVKKKDE